MKRITQLPPLSKEHHQSLVLSQKAINTAQQGDEKQIAEFCQQIVQSYPGDWKIHFKIEEDSIFHVIQHLSADHNSEQKKILSLCDQLEKEHRQMDAYYEQMKSGNYSVLGEFGALLKQHSCTEERELFPLLEEYLDTATLEKIYQTSVDYRKETK